MARVSANLVHCILGDYFAIGPSRTGIFRRSRSTPKARNSRVASRVPEYFFYSLTFNSFAYGVGRGCGVGRGLGVGWCGVAVAVAVAVGVALGVTLGVTVGVAVGVALGVTVGLGDGVAHGGISKVAEAFDDGA
jgi:hypothetical protein